eukprot:2318906-Lingulodinium_polyedra.AAC.1
MLLLQRSLIPARDYPMVMKECAPAMDFQQLSETTRRTFKEFRTLKGDQNTFGRSQRLQQSKTACGFEAEPDSASEIPAPARANADHPPETWDERPSASVDEE